MRTTRLAFRVALALTLTASPAAAQFTAVVAPPRTREPAANVAQATPGATRDSVGQTTLTDMRAWVDSAAGVTAPAAAADSVRDSTAVVTSASGAVAQRPDTLEAGVTGMRAPDTATMLPAAALAGLLMLGAGAWLLRRARA